jgi:hypothetical protein
MDMRRVYEFPSKDDRLLVWRKGIKIKAGLRTELRREPWEIELADITD